MTTAGQQEWHDWKPEIPVSATPYERKQAQDAHRDFMAWCDAWGTYTERVVPVLDAAEVEQVDALEHQLGRRLTVREVQKIKLFGRLT